MLEAKPYETSCIQPLTFHLKKDPGRRHIYVRVYMCLRERERERERERDWMRKRERVQNSQTVFVLFTMLSLVFYISIV